MPRCNTRDVAALADMFPDAVATWTDLLRLGVPQGLPARKCQPGGGWTRLLTGVYLLTGGSPTRRQMVRAALLRAGPGSALTGVEAAHRHGVRRLPTDDSVHVLVPNARALASQSFMVVERSRRPWSARLADGFPLVSVERALVDAARREQRLDVVRAMLADGLQRGLCTVASLTDEVVVRRLRGTAIVRTVLSEVSDGVRSAAEAWARSLVHGSNLPAPAWNVALRTADGRSLGVVDAWWDDVGLAWEIDSLEFHLTPDGYARTMRKHSALASAGVLVVHTLPSQLQRDTAAVLRDLTTAHASAATRPRPPVQAVLE
ncbi:hypothetical protein [Kutzneria kofuensis]|uniref:Transcriptional regulator, AbiEi antitoxin, Type IV TA system n=1 Tax=Kutzneria kofuensis TaxID=103725 RepID=A0A7W9NHT9_9PSEU|nr:hypothetical protein [Kutzneria kofuensis]MBB5893150.1 hypothetical protein [Kutzneria kofuensis]